MSFDDYVQKLVKEYKDQESEYDNFEAELKGDYSLENIRRVIRDRMYSEKGKIKLNLEGIKTERKRIRESNI